MITDTVENARQYESLSPIITEGLKVLGDKQLINQPDGRYDIDGDKLFYIIMRYTTKPLEEGLLEAHEKYIDIQYVVSGAEQIGYAPVANLQVETPYDKDKDAAFYTKGDKVGYLKLVGGMFSVFFPDEAHMPACQIDGPQEVHKVVVKIRV